MHSNITPGIGSLIRRLPTSGALVVAMLMVGPPGLAQEVAHPDGAYRTFLEYAGRKPLFHGRFEVSKVKAKRKYELDFLRLEDRNARHTVMDKSWWGVVIDDTLYLNCNQLGLGKGYVRMKLSGTYCYFTAPAALRDEQRRQLWHNSILFGAVGGGATVIHIHQDIKDRVHYVLDPRSGSIRLLEPNHLDRIMLEDYPDLQQQYRSEPDPTSIDVLVEYVRAINSKPKRR